MRRSPVEADHSQLIGLGLDEGEQRLREIRPLGLQHRVLRRRHLGADDRVALDRQFMLGIEQAIATRVEDTLVATALQQQHALARLHIHGQPEQIGTHFFLHPSIPTRAIPHGPSPVEEQVPGRAFPSDRTGRGLSLAELGHTTPFTISRNARSRVESSDDPGSARAVSAPAQSRSSGVLIRFERPCGPRTGSRLKRASGSLQNSVSVKG
jgi:hypothetical protein